MNRSEYFDKCEKCRGVLHDMLDNKVIDVGPFVSALKYVLEIRLGRPCIIYNSQYGEIDFSINGVRFKLLWQPKSVDMKLIYRHMEGDRFIDSGVNLNVPDLFVEVFDIIEFGAHNATPFDI